MLINILIYAIGTYLLIFYVALVYAVLAQPDKSFIENLKGMIKW